ncbi:murein L,D-transpeptidase [Arcticibacter sp.]|uniref:L,D-transpeptidase family protein n=1 Tax=Arcticibacter sp. TaxID=1872630 RepID=UPI00388D94CD
MKKIFSINHTLTFLVALLFILSASSCSKRKSGDQPLMDSTYIVQYMNAEPRFKDDIYWAKLFYKERAYELAWFKGHELVPQAQAFIDELGKAGEDGLDPKDYQLVDFEKLFKDFKGIKRDLEKRDSLELEIDMALTSSYLNWSSDYYRGLLAPSESRKADWDINLNKMNLSSALTKFLNENAEDDIEFRPNHPEYANLRKALASFREVQKAGGWPKIPANATITDGQSSPVVPLLKARLATFLGKDSTVMKDDKPIFSSDVKSALKKFQETSGLTATGRLNAETIRFMNVPVEDRIRQIIINMERWRWIPESFGTDYLIVNIPEFKLRVYEQGKEVMNMKVIVGKELHSTPIFNDKMEHIVLAPYWNIPPGILKDEIAPSVRANPGYLASKDMEVITNDGTVVDPGSVDWSTAGTSGFKYIVRRRPGPNNDLGNVKFIFPNSRNIYLHDTPADQLFNASKRDFSHGCVRVEKPIDLAVYLLRNVGGWDKSKIMEQIKTGNEKYVPLKAKLPVYLVYFTASADAEGHVRFFDDVYGHDKKLKSMYFSKL